MKILDVPRSGSYAGMVSSRNRYGQYVRTRATPVNPTTPSQSVARARLAAVSSAWRTLTTAQRDGWAALGAALTRTDSLGQVYSLTGAQAHQLVNVNRLIAGVAAVATAPTPNVPPTVTSLSVSADPLTVVFTPTPLEATQQLWVFASPPRSAGRSFEKDFRLIKVAAAATASPLNVSVEYAAKFGTPPDGSTVFVRALVYDTGFTGLPAQASVLIE